MALGTQPLAWFYAAAWPVLSPPLTGEAVHQVEVGPVLGGKDGGATSSTRLQERHHAREQGFQSQKESCMTSLQPLKISHLTWIAKGAQRLILRHPSSPSLIIKISYVGDLNGKLLQEANTTKTIRNRYIVSVERRIYKRFAPKFESRPNEAPVPIYHGTVITDIGLADVYEGIFNRDCTKLGMTLVQIVRRNLLTPKVLIDLNYLVARLDNWDIPASDIHANNIVYGYRNGETIFVLVDGFGDYRKMPLQTWFRRMRRKQTSISFARIARNQGLVWDDKNRRFLT
jgi:hypothetical protein